MFNYLEQGGNVGRTPKPIVEDGMKVVNFGVNGKHLGNRLQNEEKGERWCRRGLSHQNLGVIIIMNRLSLLKLGQ